MTPTVGISSTHPKTMPADHAEIPVWNAENWFYEDFEIGHKIRSLRRTISEGESMAFNALVLDMHPYVADQRFAEREGIFGKRLVAECIRFARQAGYTRVTLWTHRVLEAARKIYVGAGFTLSKEWTHDDFGKTLVAETWDLEL